MPQWQKVENLNLFDVVDAEARRTVNIETIALECMKVLQANAPNSLFRPAAMTTLRALVRQRLMQKGP